MNLLLIALGLLTVSGFASCLAGRSHTLAARVGATGCVAGCALGLLPACTALIGRHADSVRLPWAVPGGSLYLELDALSAFFLLPILGLCALAAVYAVGYFRDHRGSKTIGVFWLFCNLLAASMVMVVLARNGVLFLVAWEAMALTSFFLVTYEDEKAHVRQAGWIYLVAAHLGTAFLFGLFALLERETGSLDFDVFARHGAFAPGAASAIFLLALVGFGAKAGFVPFHVWLPEAHPAAPSPVSAVMSGVMIKTGIYGLVRVITFLDVPPMWWGGLLAGIGAAGAIYGVVLAMAQHDLKRLLAYSSVENIGIIAMGLGVGLVGLSTSSPAIATLGFAGALLHVLNHAVFKGLLFLGAGNVLHAAGAGNMERLGGLLKRMPRTGAAFLVGAAAIAGLPPLNGFVSEFLIFFAALLGLKSGVLSVAVTLLGATAALALISGLAAACFCKAFGIVFLGEARSSHVQHAHEAPASMTGPLFALAALCAVPGLLAPTVLAWITPAVHAATGIDPALALHGLDTAAGALHGVSAVFAVVIAAALLLELVRRRLLTGRSAGETVTWDCGYAEPTARMQYTGSSFTQPLTALFGWFLRKHAAASAPAGLFPESSVFRTESPDLCTNAAYRPLFAGVAEIAMRLRWLQQGSLHLYVLYIAATLLVLLVWKLR